MLPVQLLPDLARFPLQVRLALVDVAPPAEEEVAPLANLTLRRPQLVQLQLKYCQKLQFNFLKSQWNFLCAQV